MRTIEDSTSLSCFLAFGEGPRVRFLSQLVIRNSKFVIEQNPTSSKNYRYNKFQSLHNKPLRCPPPFFFSFVPTALLSLSYYCRQSCSLVPSSISVRRKPLAWRCVCFTIFWVNFTVPHRAALFSF
jgi:hypothetical protein